LPVAARVKVLFRRALEFCDDRQRMQGREYRGRVDLIRFRKGRK